jgi:hypothetical protein
MQSEMKKLRSWVTPITIGSFLLLGVTGLLMFFKAHGALIVVAHEWLSPIFVVGACLHIWLNWGAVRATLSRPRGIITVGFFAALLAISIAPFKEVDEIAREHGHGQEVIGRKAAELLLQARISTVAELTGRTPQRLRERLDRCGIRITTDDVFLVDAARQSQVSPVHALHAVLQAE